MKLTIVGMESGHVEQAAALASRRYAALREQIPCLPESYEDSAVFTPLLENLADHGSGVVALDGRRLVGFLAAYFIDTFRGRPSIFSPEWGNGASLGASRRIYEAMYPKAAPEWLRRGAETHLISLFSHDAEALEGWWWAGFGRMVCDAVRPVEPIADESRHVDVRRAGPGDIRAVMAMERDLKAHLMAPPVYLLREAPEDRATWDARLRDPNVAIWLASAAGRPMGFLHQGPATDTACDVIVDEKTTSITGAYVIPEERGRGVATALLAHALLWAKEHGYRCCAVDFEAMNVPASRFWLRYFQPAVVSLGRSLDPRLVRT